MTTVERVLGGGIGMKVEEQGAARAVSDKKRRLASERSDSVALRGEASA
jgi:hypothetical protein